MSNTVKIPRSVYLWLLAHDASLVPMVQLKQETGKGNWQVEIPATKEVLEALNSESIRTKPSFVNAANKVEYALYQASKAEGSTEAA